MAARPKVLLGSLVALVVLVGLGISWYLGRDAPAEVTLEAAVSSVDEDPPGGAATGSASSGTSTEPASTGAESVESPVEGTWTVDAESGGFDYESATGTFVGFRITEELSSIGSTEAVGRTGDVTGSTTIEGTTLTAATFEADATTITTNETRRDDKVQEALETATFPTASFVLTEPVDLGEGAADGEAVNVTAAGELTLHGVSRPVQVALDAQLVDQTVVVVGSLDIVFADYGVEVPSSPIVVSVEDHGTVELQLLLTQT